MLLCLVCCVVVYRDVVSCCVVFVLLCVVLCVVRVVVFIAMLRVVVFCRLVLFSCVVFHLCLCPFRVDVSVRGCVCCGLLLSCCVLLYCVVLLVWFRLVCCVWCVAFWFGVCCYVMVLRCVCFLVLFVVRGVCCCVVMCSV